MKRLGLALAVVSASLVFGTDVGAADPTAMLTNEATTSLGNVTALLTALDPALADTAVTDDQLVVAGVVVDSIPQLLSDPHMLIVDDDLQQCPNAEFTTINAAVTAALPGALIRVCPGLYKESVPITKPGLTLQAPRQQGTATECQASTVPDPTQQAIVSYNATLNGGNPSEGFDVEASNVTIEGFTVQPDPALVTQDGVGIFTSRFYAGYDIRHNVVQNNTFGIYVNSDGSAPTYVRENCSRNNNLAGAGSGNGIYSDQGLSNAQITNNYLTGDQSNAIVLDSFLTAPHDIAITHNESINDGSIATYLTGPTAYNLTVDYNRVLGSVGSGIVTNNVTNSEYAYNDVENGTFNGVSLHDTTNSLVKSNKAIGFKLNGVRIGESSDGNTVATNRAENNTEAGLAATSHSVGNTIQENHMKGNAPDCYDDTAGTGTAGTGNLWINDTGSTENRPGLCKHASP